MKNPVSFDRNLLKKASDGDQEAYAQIIHYFYPIIRMISYSYHLSGGDQDDLMQEGLIGLYRATVSFDESKNDNFVKYAKICIHRAMLNAIKNDTRQKHFFLNSSVSFSEELGLTEQSAEDSVLQREHLINVYERIEDELSDMERAVLSLYMDGLSYKEIADKLQKNTKAVDNALARIRGKLQ